MSDDDAEVLGCEDVARMEGEKFDPRYLPDTCCGTCHEDGDRFDLELKDGRTAVVCCWQRTALIERLGLVSE